MTASPLRQRVFKVLRAALALGLMVLLLSRLELGSVVASFSSLDVPTVIALVVLAAVMPLLLARRVQVLARPLIARAGPGKRAATLPTVFADALAAAAAGTVLPSAVGGDLMRAWLLSDYFGGEDARSRGVSLIVVDRLIGLLALSTPPIVLALLWNRSGFGTSALFAALGLLLVTWQLGRVLRGVAWLVPARFQKLKAFFDALPRGVADVPNRARLEAFAWSFAYQLCVGVFFELVVATWGVDARHHEAIWVGIPVAMLLTVLPVSIGGVGWRESLFVGVFALLGLPREQGLALGLLWGFVGLTWALAGAVVLVRRGTRSPVAEANRSR